eukprot:jgi/Picsp_1/2351/NSC_05814-R1_protein
MGEIFQSQQRHRRSESSVGLAGDGYPSLSIDTNVMHHHHASVSSSGARAGMGADARNVSQNESTILRGEGGAVMVEPEWAMVWDVFSARYKRVEGLKLDGIWEPLPCLEAVTGSFYHGRRHRDGVQSSLSDVVFALDASLSETGSPWITPEYLDRGNHVGSKPHLLFQYKPYSRQERLKISDSDLAAALEAAFGRVIDSGMQQMPEDTVSPLSQASSAGLVILIKVVMDLYLDKGPEAAFSCVLYMVQKPLINGNMKGQCAVFDFILNLMVHGELMYPEDDIQEEGAKGKEALESLVGGMDLNGNDQDWRQTVSQAMRTNIRNQQERKNRSIDLELEKGTQTFSMDNLAKWPPLSTAHLDENADRRKEQFFEWIRQLFFKLLKLLAAVDMSESSSEVWASAFSCLIALCTKDGYIVQSLIEHLPLRATAKMLQVGRKSFWPSRIQSLIGVMAANMMYTAEGTAQCKHVSEKKLDLNKLSDFGGITEVVKEYHAAPTITSCQSLFCVMYDYIIGMKAGPSDGTWKFSIHETFEVQAVAYCLLRAKAAPALQEYLVMPKMELDDAINACLIDHIHKEIGPRTIDPENETIPEAFIAFCVNSLKHLGELTYPIPSDLALDVESTCVAGIFGEAPSSHWKHLEQTLLDGTKEGRDAGKSWLAKIMIATADRAVEEAWVTRKNIIPPPVPLIPSDNPGESLYTLGDALMSALCKSRGTVNTQNGNYKSFESDDDVITNFASAVIQAIGAMRLRALGLVSAWSSDKTNDLLAKWTSGGVDINRLSISTLERAYEWILKYSDSPVWCSALANLSEYLVSLLTVRRVNFPNIDGDAFFGEEKLREEQKQNSFIREEEENVQKLRSRPAIQPLYIPSPTASNDAEAPTVSPFKKVPGAPKLAAAWRRLTTPHSSRTTRPGSAESEFQVTTNEPVRPLSAGAAALDSARIQPKAENIFKPSSDLNSSSPEKMSGALSTGHTSSSLNNNSKSMRIPGWQSLREKVQAQRQIEKTRSLKATTEVYRKVSLYEETIDPVESFITGISSCPVEMLELVNPSLLKDIFEALDVDGFSSQVALHRDASSTSLYEMETVYSTKRQDQEYGNIGMSERQTSIQAGRPFWDVRFAIFILLVSSFSLRSKHSGHHPLLEKHYLRRLIKDRDVRIRQHASSFILQRFANLKPAEFMLAMKSLVSLAQQADDEHILRNPDIQLHKMMEMRLFDIDESILVNR